MLQPLGDRVLIEPSPEVTETADGIIIVRRYWEAETTGKVVAVGQGRFTKKGVPLPHVCAVGDSVVFGKYVGEKLTVDGKALLVVREDDILATVDVIPP